MMINRLPWFQRFTHWLYLTTNFGRWYCDDPADPNCPACDAWLWYYWSWYCDDMTWDEYVESMCDDSEDE